MYDLGSIKASSDLFELASSLTHLKRIAGTEGGEWAGPCPFCGGKDRFHIQPDSPRGQYWFCRKCTDGLWCDVIDFIMRRDNCTLPEAAERLQSGSLVPAPWPRRPAPQKHVPPKPSQRWQESAAEIVEQCAGLLWTPEGRKARDWLHGRGLTDDTLRRWQIGFNPSHGKDTGRQIGDLWVPCGIVIPGLVASMPHYIKVRLAKVQTKYDQVRGSRKALFGADTLADHHVAVLAEGEFDAMLLEQEAGDLVGVATLGSASATLDLSTWGAYVFPVSRLLVVFDADAAGIDGARRMSAMSARIRVAHVPRLQPGHKDLTDYFVAGGSLRDWLQFELARLGN